MHSDLDNLLELLQSHKKEWVILAIREKIDLFKQVLELAYACRESWVALSCQYKKIPKESHIVGEEWLIGPVSMCRVLRLAINSLEELERYSLIKIPRNKVKQVSKEQISVDVFPNSLLEKIIYSGIKAQVWMEPGIDAQHLQAHMASNFSSKQPSLGCVSLVLGAGNVSSIGPLDVIQKLLEGKVVLLKMNPVNDYLLPLFLQVFAPLIKRNFAHIVRGDADIGEYLCQHPMTEDIHITGSDQTHDAICYGTGEEGEVAKRHNKPRLKKTISSELGNVSPIIVVPGKWSRSALKFHAENVATQLVNNAGFNCLAAKVLVIDHKWPQKKAFLKLLGETLGRLKPREAYYPGAQDRYEKFIEAHSTTAAIYGQKSTHSSIPWTIIEDLSSEQDSICYTKESFCGLMAQTNISSKSTEDFMVKAAKFCNEKLWGTLCACVIIDKKTQQTHAKAFHQLISDLKYGGIGINQWHGLLYSLGVTTWGAYPGHTWDNIQSGQGTVHNTLLFDKPQKSVLFGPFTTTILMPFKPAWFASNQAMPSIARALCDMEYKPGWFKLPKLIFATMKSL